MSPYAPPIQTDSSLPAEQKKLLEAKLDATRRETKPAMSVGQKIGIGALVLFFVSLLLPAIKVRIFSTTEMFGFGAFLWSFVCAAGKPDSVLLLIAFGNAWFLILPLIARSRRWGVLTVSALVSWVTTLAAGSLTVYPLDKGGTDDLLAGYYVWLASFFVAAVGMTVRAFERASESREEALAAWR